MSAKHFILLAYLLLAGFLLRAQVPKVEVLKYPELADRLQEAQGLHIVNFWATWCRPCVAELPHFAQIAQKYPTEAKFLIVSLDFAEQLNTRLMPFLNKKNWGLECVLLDEVDGERWMPQIDPKWDGAIPATLVLNHRTNTRFLHNGELTAEELEALVLRYR